MRHLFYCIITPDFILTVTIQWERSLPLWLTWTCKALRLTRLWGLMPNTLSIGTQQVRQQLQVPAGKSRITIFCSFKSLNAGEHAGECWHAHPRKRLINGRDTTLPLHSHLPTCTFFFFLSKNYTCQRLLTPLQLKKSSGKRRWAKALVNTHKIH